MIKRMIYDEERHARLNLIQQWEGGTHQCYSEGAKRAVQQIVDGVGR